jgi:hypothetical protein
LKLPLCSLFFNDLLNTGGSVNFLPGWPTIFKILMKKKSQLALKLKGFTSSVTLLGAAKFEVGGLCKCQI